MPAPTRIIRRLTIGIPVVILFSVGLTGAAAGEMWWLTGAWSDFIFVLSVAAMWLTGLAVYPSGHKSPVREALSRRLIGISLLVGIIVATYDRTHGYAALRTGTLVFVGLALFLLAVCIGGTALLTIRKAYSPDPTARKGRDLVISGIYAYMRHPIYTALILVGTGVPLLARSLWGLAAGIAFLAPAVIMRIREEEASLIATYGDEYRRYAARVRRLIPFIF